MTYFILHLIHDMLWCTSGIAPRVALTLSLIYAYCKTNRADDVGQCNWSYLRFVQHEAYRADAVFESTGQNEVKVVTKTFNTKKKQQ